MIEYFKELLDPTICQKVVKSEDSSKGWEVKLIEKAKNTKTSEITLYGFSEETICFKLDAQILKCNKEGVERWVDRRMSEYLNPNARFINKGSDAVIITKLAKKWYAFICELKSNHEGKYELQMLNTRLFVEYVERLIQSIQQCIDCKQQKRSKLIYRFILFNYKKLNKRRGLTNKPTSDNSSLRCRDSKTLKNSVYVLTNRKQNLIHDFIP